MMTSPPNIDERSPVRQCALTRVRARKEELVRLALGPGSIPFVDLAGRAPGRGTYVAAERDVVAEALSRKGAARAFRREVAGLEPAAVEEALELAVRHLSRRIVELVGIARRAGVLVIGVEAGLDALAQPGAFAVVASDASDRARDRVNAGRSVDIATKAELGRWLGRREVSLAVVREGTIADRLRAESRRLSGLLKPASGARSEPKASEDGWTGSAGPGPDELSRDREAAAGRWEISPSGAGN
jgi:hypothetical protein